MHHCIMNSNHLRHNSNVVRIVLYSIGTFTFLSVFLNVIGFVPELTDQTPLVVLTAPTPSAPMEEVRAIVDTNPVPVRVTIRSIGTDTSITNPVSTDIAALDRALLTGAVRYPGSPDLGAQGNVLIFGHSSYLPVVKNKAYQAFNDLGKLESGDEIVVDSASHRYTYVVTDTRHAKATEVSISFDSDQPTLTLATCNAFGAKEDRFVVTAVLTHVKEIL